MDFMQAEHTIFVAAHRGWSSRYPENTMEAFRGAVSLGVDQIETDVRITKDGELVIIHDAEVDRTTNGSGKVNSFTLSELKKLDAGKIRNMEGQGYRIPTFEEFVEYMKTLPDMTLDIELKEYPEKGNEAVAYEVCDRVLQALDDAGYADRMVVNTFSGKLQEYIQEHYGSKFRRHIYFPISYLRKGMTRDPYQSGAYCCCVFRTKWTDEANIGSKEDCDFIRSCGIHPWAGSAVKDARTVDVAIANGYELITCNNPDEVLRLLREKGYHK